MMSPVLKMRFQTLAVLTLSLPLCAFVFCVLWSLIYNFDSSTSTHCGVPNFLPSISSAIGGYAPQMYVWRIAVAVHSAPRFLVAAMYYGHLCTVLVHQTIWQGLAIFTFVLQIIEIGSLIGLTYISSTENFPVHKRFFVLFMLSALANMLLQCLLPKYGTKQPASKSMRKSLRFKTIFSIINIFSFTMAVYCYFRHNWYCEPGMYTMFALFEYGVVLTNMGFHMTAYWDFADHAITVCSF